MSGSRSEKGPIHWTEVQLYYADGSGITSVWSAGARRATERDDGRETTSDRTTDAHLRALDEIRCCDSCADWFPNPELSELGPRRADIDWTGFPLLGQDDE